MGQGVERNGNQCWLKNRKLKSDWHRLVQCSISLLLIGLVTIACTPRGTIFSTPTSQRHKEVPPAKTSAIPEWSNTTGGAINHVAISSDGNYIVAGGTDHNLYLFNKNSSIPLWNYTGPGSFNSVAISADGQYI